MAHTNAERQRLWRERHPEKRDERFDAFKVKKAEEAAATECDHEDRGVRVTLIYCGRCRRLLFVSDDQLEDAHKEWESLPPEPDDGG